MKFSAASRRRAFTLLEMMVAIAIFAMVVATIYSTWILIVRSSQIAQETSAQTRARSARNNTGTRHE